MNQAVSDVSSFVVSESGVFPSVKAFKKLAAANQRAIEQEMKEVEDAVRPVVRKLLNRRISRAAAVKEIHNILHGKIGEEALGKVLEDALGEHPELMVGGKRKTRRGKRGKKTRRASKKGKRGSKRSTRGVRGGVAPPMRKSRRSQRGGKVYTTRQLEQLRDEVNDLIARAKGVVAEAKANEGRESTLHNWLFGGISRGSRYHDEMGKVWELEWQLDAFTARGGRMERMFDDEIMEDRYGRWQVDDTQFMNAYFKLKNLTDEVERVVTMRKRIEAEERERMQERRHAEAAAKAAAEAQRRQRVAHGRATRELHRDIQAKLIDDRLPGRNLVGDPLPPPEPKTWGEWAGSFF